jgi:hypothetical protein
VLAGLNSQTFNYLARHDEELQLTENVKSMIPVATSSVDFYSSCVALNRPCLFRGLSRQWQAYNKWAYANDGYAYLQEQLQG